MEDFKQIYKNKLAEIRDLYPLLKNHSDVWALGLYQSICEEQILKEFVSKTIPMDKTYRELFKRFDELTETANFNGNNDNTFSLALDKASLTNIPEIIKFLDTFGWYPSYMYSPDYDLKYSKENLKKILSSNRWPLSITFEAKYDTEEYPKKALYHLVPDILLKKVELSGLTPRSKSKIANHPDRVYLLNPADESEYEDIALALYQSLPQEIRDKIKTYYLLRIDIDELKNRIKFYTDPNFRIANGAVWTYQNIAPKYIENLGTVNIG